MGKADKLKVCPAQMVELLAAVGVAGIGFTVTFVIPGGLTQPSTVCVTEYWPVANVVAPTIVGF